MPEPRIGSMAESRTRFAIVVQAKSGFEGVAVLILSWSSLEEKGGKVRDHSRRKEREVRRDKKNPSRPLPRMAGVGREGCQLQATSRMFCG